MVVEMSLGLAMVGSVVLNLTEDYRLKKREIREIRSKWNVLMDSVGGKAENKIAQGYELLDVFIKHYGFDSIVSLPYGTSMNNLRDLLPLIEQSYGANVIIELSKSRSTAYMRVHFISNDISDIDNIRFAWYKNFFKGNECRNAYGETFSISNIETLVNPNSEEKEIVGYKLKIDIPTGLSYEKLEKYRDQISNNINKCLIRWDSISKQAECEIMIKRLNDSEKFTPIKPPSPYHFYLAMSYSYNQIMSDLSKNPHLLYTGKSQTGKTVAVMTGITNLAYHYGKEDILLFESMISAKQDLRIFKGLDICQYYANDINTSLRLFKYIKKEMYRRNRIFETSGKFIGSMYQWNEAYPKKKMPMILLAVDEMTLYAPMKSDRNNKEDRDLYNKKQECIDILTQLLIEGASSGLNVLFSLQRPDKESLSTQIKGQLGTKIGFYQPNTASSLVAMDDDSCSSLELKREAIIKYDKGVELVRTLYLTPPMIEDILKDKMVKNKKHLNIDLNGNIADESSNKPSKKELEQIDIIENKTKVNRFIENKTKKERERLKNEEYLKAKKEAIMKNSLG